VVHRFVDTGDEGGGQQEVVNGDDPLTRFDLGEVGVSAVKDALSDNVVFRGGLTRHRELCAFAVRNSANRMQRCHDVLSRESRENLTRKFLKEKSISVTSGVYLPNPRYCGITISHIILCLSKFLFKVCGCPNHVKTTYTVVRRNGPERLSLTLFSSKMLLLNVAFNVNN